MSGRGGGRCVGWRGGRAALSGSPSCCSSSRRPRCAIVAPYDPLATNWSAVRKPPSLLHPFGTDEIGRDVLARVIWGSPSLAAGGARLGVAGR